jgi:hypothetical protein
MFAEDISSDGMQFFLKKKFISPQKYTKETPKNCRVDYFSKHMLFSDWKTLFLCTKKFSSRWE